MIPVKTVSIFHDEFTPTHQAKTRAALVTEFGLNLVKVFWQLFVAADFLACDVSDHFFAGRLHHEVVAVAVCNTQQFRPHLLKTTGFLPKFSGLDHGHAQFHRTSAVHFFAHDLFNFLDHAQAHGHQGVNAGTEFFNHPGTHHQLVADHFGIGRGLFEGGNKELRGFHGGNPAIRQGCFS